MSLLLRSFRTVRPFYNTMSNTAKLGRTEASSALGAGGSARRGVKVINYILATLVLIVDHGYPVQGW